MTTDKNYRHSCRSHARHALLHLGRNPLQVGHLLRYIWKSKCNFDTSDKTWCVWPHLYVFGFYLPLINKCIYPLKVVNLCFKYSVITRYCHGFEKEGLNSEQQNTSLQYSELRERNHEYNIHVYTAENCCICCD
jgi:hypothetical protein